MAGSLSIHPLMKSYDDLRRCKNRLEHYLTTVQTTIDEQTYREIRRIIDGLQDAMDIIPDEFKKNYYEIRKIYDEIRDN